MRASRFVGLPIAFSLVLLALGAVFVPRVAAAGEYTVTEAGTLVGTSDGQFDVLGNTQGTGINSDGTVVANAYSADESTTWAVPFTSEDGKVHRFGKEKSYSYVFDVNDGGEMTGYETGRDDTQFANLQAVVWRDGKPVELPSLGGGGGRCQASALNNAGDIVGNSAIAPGDQTVHATLWHDDEPTDLGTTGGTFSYALEINDGGDVVGFSFTEGNAGQVPFIWHDGEMTALPVMEGMNGAAYGITEDGVVLGTNYVMVDNATQFFAMRWVDGELQQLPPLVGGGQGLAFEANADGQIVGWSATSDTGVQGSAAVLWEGDEVIDLNERIPDDSGYRLSVANAINDAGQIVAAASSEDDELAHAVVLSPVDEEAARIVIAGAHVPAAALRD